MTAPTARAVVVDSSAAVAIVLSEPGSDDLVDCLESTVARLMSAASRVELGIVIEARLGSSGADAISRFLRDAEIKIVATDLDVIRPGTIPEQRG
ncbi:MAG: type II toxin-antitoxin system VapC family toxin [Pseudonocardiaceae bacterium]